MMQQLGIFSYEDNCKKLLKGEINNNRIPLTLNNKIINKLSKEIAFCIKQGIHFFNSAETASITISPLLLYYGILSLSKALIIANSNGTIFLDDIKYHGLSTRPLTDKQKKFKERKNNWKLLNEYANVNDGVFFKLYKLMSKTTKLKKNDSFKLIDTLNSIPEIKELYKKILNKEPRVVNAYSEPEQVNNKVTFSIYDTDSIFFEKNIPNVQKILSKEKKGFEIKYTTINDSKVNEFKLFNTYHSKIGGRYFVLPIKYNSGKNSKYENINQLLIDYINLFILGEQVRYHQDNWNNILSGKNNAIISILESYIELVKRRFPNMVLDELVKEPFNYGTPSYLS